MHNRVSTNQYQISNIFPVEIFLSCQLHMTSSNTNGIWDTSSWHWWRKRLKISRILNLSELQRELLMERVEMEKNINVKMERLTSKYNFTLHGFLHVSVSLLHYINILPNSHKWKICYFPFLHFVSSLSSLISPWRCLFVTYSVIGFSHVIYFTNQWNGFCISINNNNNFRKHCCFNRNQLS